MQQTYHKTVLLNETLKYLDPQPNKIYVDATFGGGGHTRAILNAEPNAEVIALDWDKSAIDINGPLLLQEFGDRINLIWGSFSHLYNLLKKINIINVDGILADFGTSQYQISQMPGFSFNIETPLDMRMSPKHHKITAYDIVNRASVQELSKIFFEYGDEPKAHKIAKQIETYRKTIGRIKTTTELAKIVSGAYSKARGKIHPATKVFQALRIVVNDELNNIKSLLSQSVDLLNSSGRLVCISFHSLEDRIVKEFFRQNKDSFENLTPRIITASEEEIRQNPSARSAKLRAGRRY